MTSSYNASLHRFALFLAACTLFLVVAGALVTSNDAGLAVPDWPLSYGSLMPPMVGGIFWEHGHRMVATAVGFLTIILAVWIHRTEKRPWMRRLGWLALLAVIVQGILGGLTVRFLLPAAISSAHAGLAQLFFCTICAIALFTSRWWLTDHQRLRDTFSPHARTLAVTAAAVIFVQLLLGAAFRHGAIGILPHVIWAGVVLLTASFAAGGVRRRFGSQNLGLRRAAQTLASLIGVQILLGIVTYFALLWNQREYAHPVPPVVAITVAHVAIGALTLATAVILSLICFRILTPSGAPATVSPRDAATEHAP